MSSARLLRWSGPAAMLGGALALVVLVSNLISSEVPEAIVVGFMLAVVSLLMTGIAGLYGRKRPGALGTTGLVVAVTGLVAIITGIMITVGAGIDGGWTVMIVGLLSNAVGLTMYGIANLRAKALPRWNALPLIVGLLAGPGVFVMRVVQEIAGCKHGCKGLSTRSCMVSATTP
jgi:hypothetical protein